MLDATGGEVLRPQGARSRAAGRELRQSQRSGDTLFLHDLKHAAGRLLRQPAYSVLVAVTMAIGIGATTVLFSVVHGVLLRPLPWPESDRLISLAEKREGATREWPWILTNATYHAWRQNPVTVEGIAGYDRGDTVTLSGDAGAERLVVARVTAGLFPLLDAVPEVGSLFGDRDEVDGGVVLLSHGLWQQRFGGRADVVGETVRFDGSPVQIVGVMPAGFHFPDREVRAWLPMAVPEVFSDDGASTSIHIFRALAKLRPGVTPEQAAAEATSRARGAPDLGMAAEAMFGSREPPWVVAALMREAVTAEVRPALWLLLAAVSLLLATAIANVASLQLARGTARSRELAVRSTLGASGSDLRRLLLAESCLLGLLGGSLGLALAWAAHRVLPSLLPAGFPRLDDIAVDVRIALFTLLLGLGAGVAIGILPALASRRLSLAQALSEGGARALGGGTSRSGTGARLGARGWILVGQVAIATVLLVGGLQLGRSFFAMLGAERGYRADGLLTASLPMPESLYAPERRQQILEELVERLEQVPTVRSVGFSSIVPLAPFDSMMAFSMSGRDGGEEATVNTGIRIVSPGYFEAMGRRLVSGRLLSGEDVGSSAPVVVVNERFVRGYLKGDGIGALIPARLDGERPDWEVVGVVEDIVQDELGDTTQPEMFVSYAQLGQGVRFPSPTLLVRASERPEALAPLLRDLVRQQDAALVPESVQTMDDRLRDSLAQPRLYSFLLGAFAVCALTIAGVGLFGLLSYFVALRRREIGLRMALGARRTDIVRLVAGQGLGLTLVGLLIGLAASALVARLLADLLYGVGPYEVSSFVAVAAMLAVLALLACALPARRAATIDPQQTLRAE